MFINKKLKKQKGQSLVYVAVLIIVLISGVFFVLDLGTIVNTKIKFQNGADAAALAVVAVKISKHHTDTLVRTSMYHESVAAQARLRASQALLAQIVLEQPVTVNPPAPKPGDIGIPQMPTYQPSDQQIKKANRYKQLVNKTYRHVVKLHRERKALEAYYGWLTGNPGDLGNSALGVGMQATTEAARIGFRSNTQGLLSIDNNLKILTDTKELEENYPKFGTETGVPYGNEGATKVGNFGKTIIQFDGDGIMTTQGASFLNYANNNKFTMTTNAAARVASSDELNRPRTKLGIWSGAIPFDMLWYSPRLEAIQKMGPGIKTAH